MTRLVFLLLLTAGLVTVWGCSKENSASNDDTRPVVSCGLPPVAYLAEAVAGDRFVIKTVLPEGRSPHDYTPGPAEVAGLSGSKVFMITGMEFEKRIAAALDGAEVEVRDISLGVKRIPLDPGHAHDHDHDGDGALGDPHIWLSIPNARVMAGNIKDILAGLDPDGAEYFEGRLALLDRKLSATENYVHKLLSSYQGKSFLVYHPAFGYFADQTRLRQIAVEHGGHEVTPAALAEVIALARENHIDILFVQKSFNPSGAEALRSAIGGEVVEVDPLGADIDGNIRIMAEFLNSSYERQVAAEADRKHQEDVAKSDETQK